MILSQFMVTNKAFIIKDFRKFL